LGLVSNFENSRFSAKTVAGATQIWFWLKFLHSF
jgi:hypothetical protein